MVMPVMDGAELASEMRMRETHRGIRIVIMTSLPAAIPRQDLRFDAVLRKPFTPEHLLTTVRRCLDRSPPVKDSLPHSIRHSWLGGGENEVLDSV